MAEDMAQLVRFLPVALEMGAAPAIDWGDLGDIRFEEPFFLLTIERWARQDPPPRLVRTALDAMEILDRAPSLDPDLLIFHLSHCGSTLTSRLIATERATLVISEPPPLNALLAPPQPIETARHAQLLRLLVRAFARRRFGDERRYALKLSSWNIMRLDLFRRAFPEAKLVWIGREPVEVMAAILADPPGWLRMRDRPWMAEGVFGLRPSRDAEEFCARALAAMLNCARAAREAGALVVDYRDLPQAVWQRIVPFAGWTASEDGIARMQEEARFSAKDAGRRPFLGDSPVKQAVPDRVRQLAAEFLKPPYGAGERVPAL